jgi:hypothetical protein
MVYGRVWGKMDTSGMNQTADTLMGIFGMKRVEKPIKTKAKPKKAKLSTLIAKADTLASRYVRLKYSDHAGMVKCVSCETVIHWKDAHCAHFIERGKKATRWTEENLHPACPSCNVYRKEHHMREYTLAIVDLYGREKIDEFREAAKAVLSASQVRQLAEEAIEYYSEALKAIDKQ